MKESGREKNLDFVQEHGNMKKTKQAIEGEKKYLICFFAWLKQNGADIRTCYYNIFNNITQQAYVNFW